MAKIKIAESELGQLIGESVVSVLNEDLQTRRNDAYQAALTDYQNAQKPWESLTPDEKKTWYNSSGYGGAQKSDAEAKASYEFAQKNRVNDAKIKLDRKTRRNGLQFRKDLDIANQSLTNLYKQLNVNDHTAAMGAIQSLQTQNQAYQKAIADLTGILNGTIKEGVATREAFDGQTTQETQSVQIPGVEDVLNKVRNLINQNARLHREIGSRGNINTALKTIATWKQNSVKLANMEKANQQNAANAQAGAQQTATQNRTAGQGNVATQTTQPKTQLKEQWKRMLQRMDDADL